MTRASRGLLRLWAAAGVAWVVLVYFLGAEAFDRSPALQWGLALGLPAGTLVLITAARWIARGFTGR